MTTDLTKLEKTALIATGAAAAWKILLWQLGYTVSSSGPAWWGVDILSVLRVCFAMLSFVSFDLVLVALVLEARRNGCSKGGMIAASITALVSGAIALEVAKVINVAALHATPMLVLATFVLHLMTAHRMPAAVVPQTVEDAPQPLPHIEINNQILNAPAATLPPTVREFVRAHAAQLPEMTAPALAVKIGTSADTVRRALVIEQEGT